MKTCFRDFLAADRGATAIEYAMIAAFIALVIVGVVGNIGSQLSGILSEASSALK